MLFLDVEQYRLTVQRHHWHCWPCSYCHNTISSGSPPVFFECTSTISQTDKCTTNLVCKHIGLQTRSPTSSADAVVGPVQICTASAQNVLPYITAHMQLGRIKPGSQYCCLRHIATEIHVNTLQHKNRKNFLFVQCIVTCIQIILLS